MDVINQITREVESVKGASILRVHDVKEAAEAVKIVEAMKEGRT